MEGLRLTGLRMLGDYNTGMDLYYKEENHYPCIDNVTKTA